jgi:GxxExxY protein
VVGESNSFDQKMDRDQLEKVATIIVDAAVCVHRELGPGLLESIYQKALQHELRSRGLKAECEVGIEVKYKGQNLGKGYVIDILVENSVILELKSVETLQSVHDAQLITYLKLSGHHLGFLLNFNERLLKHGLKRMVYKIEEVRLGPSHEN